MRGIAAALVTASAGLGYTLTLPKFSLTDSQRAAPCERLFPADGSVDHFRPLHGVTTLDALTYARLPVVVMPLPFYTYCR